MREIHACKNNPGKHKSLCRVRDLFKEFRSCTIFLFYKSFSFLRHPATLQWYFWELWGARWVLLSFPETSGSSSSGWEAAVMWPSRAGAAPTLSGSTQQRAAGRRHPTLSNALTLPLGIAFSSSCVMWRQQARRAYQNPGLLAEELLWYVSFCLKGLSLLTSSDTLLLGTLSVGLMAKVLSQLY